MGRYLQCLVVASCLLLSACGDTGDAASAAREACTYGDPAKAGNMATKRVALELANKKVPTDEADIDNAYIDLVREVGADADVVREANAETLRRSVQAANEAAEADPSWNDMRDAMTAYADWMAAGAPGKDDPVQRDLVQSWYVTNTAACERAASS